VNDVGATAVHAFNRLTNGRASMLELVERVDGATVSNIQAAKI
jgi:hypothetical protein